MRFDLPDALHSEARVRSHRALLGTVLLAVLVVAASGISGTAHFAGLRWVPHWQVTGPAAAHKVRAPPAAPVQAQRQSGGSFPLLVLWIIIGIAAIVAAILLWRWLAGRPSREAASRRSIVAAATSEIPIEPEPEPDTPALRTGIELALQVLDEQREPADAIVRAWLGLQETAEESGIIRRASETPTEFTSRILSRAGADDRAVRTLLRLYLRTRFGDHPVTSDDVAAVRAALQELIRTWGAPESPPVAGPR